MSSQDVVNFVQERIKAEQLSTICEEVGLMEGRRGVRRGMRGGNVFACHLSIVWAVSYGFVPILKVFFTT